MHLIDRIYAAACGETSWERTLAEVCRVGEMAGCALIVVDRLERRRDVFACCGLSSAAEREAMSGPLPGEAQLTDSILRSVPGTVWKADQIRSDRWAETASFWRDPVRPKGSVPWAWVVLGRDERQVVCLEAYAGAARESSRPDLDDLLRRLAPHLTRAWRLRMASRAMRATPMRVGSPSRSHADAPPAPEAAAMPAVVRLRAEFGLTKAEARLALRLAEGSSLASAALAFNVKLTTIRSQLQQVFAKTGTSRQTELLALLLSRGHGTQARLETR